MELGYRMIDSDNHYYEQDDCFSRHIDPKYRDQAISLVSLDDGSGDRRWALNGEFVSFITWNPADRVPPPGALAGLFAGKASYESLEFLVAHDRPAFMHRKERLDLMDEQNIEASIMIPTIAVLVEGDFGHLPDVLCANYRAFNRWLEEEWGYGDDGRIFGVPLLTMLDIDWAVEELQRVADLGAKMFYLKTGPINDQSPADTKFDRFWSLVEETGLHPMFHIGDNVFTELYAKHWGEDPNRDHQSFSAMQHLLCNGERPVNDTLATLVLHNLFGRFPGIEVMTVEHGSSWVPPLLKGLDKAAMMARHGTWPFGTLDAKPSEIFSEHVFVAPYPEDDVQHVAGVIGADRVIFGSDYPHPEGVAEPDDFLRDLDGMSDADIRLIMRENAAGLLGLEA